MSESTAAVSVTVTIELAQLARVPDERLLMLWHVAQFNPAPHGDKTAGEMVGKIGSEIIRRWIAATAPSQYHHQPRDYYWHHLCRFASHRDGDWHPDPDKIAAYTVQPPSGVQGGVS